MINRDNWKDVRQFIEYQQRVEQKDDETIRNFWVYLRHLLEWADSTPFPGAGELDNPSFPVYLLTARNDGEFQPDKVGKTLALATQSKGCSYARMFFKWAKIEHAARYRPLRESWIETIKPRKAARSAAKLDHLEAWTLEDVLKVADLKKDQLLINGKIDYSLLRARASICFLFLSGMRVSAFVSLPISCVDIERGMIEQNPEKGVLTKFRKAAITSLLPIPELSIVVKEWDQIIREKAPKDRRWFTSVDFSNNFHDDGLLKPAQVRGKRNPLVSGIARICEIADVEYKSPHKLRHGHAIYGIKHAQTIGELKAISQNLMHSSIQITDGIYGNLASEDTAKLIAGLSMHPKSEQINGMDASALLELLKNPAIVELLKAIKSA